MRKSKEYNFIILVVFTVLSIAFMVSLPGITGMWGIKTSFLQKRILISPQKDTTQCIDSDGGFKPDTAGTVVFKYRKFPDSCDANAVNENFCSEGRAKTRKYDCTIDNKICQNSACTPPPSTTATTILQPVCGNGVLEQNEQCDPGRPGISDTLCFNKCDKISCTCSLISTPGASTSIRPPALPSIVAPPGGTCGDGTLDAGEQCEPGKVPCPEGMACSNNCICMEPEPTVPAP